MSRTEIELDVFNDMTNEIVKIVRDFHADLDDEILSRLEIVPARDFSHGHLACNAAMVLARPLKSNPRAIATQLAEKIAQLPQVEKVDIAGPGFINVNLKPEIYHRVIKDALVRGAKNFGKSDMGCGERVNVEYVSANPTGPLHVGHCRGAIVGDVLASLMERVGYDVTREYYINDAGTQVRALAWAAYWRYLQAIEKPQTAEDFDALSPVGLQYQGDYLVEVGDKLKEKFGEALVDAQGAPLPEREWLDKVKPLVLDEMMDLIRRDLKTLNISHEKFTSEDAILQSGVVEQALGKLAAQDLIYKGVLEAPKGKTPDDWEAREQSLFRSTAFGDDQDRAILKSDGTNTYFANDIAYHADKMSRADHLIDVWGADHGGYVSRIKASIKALDASKKFEVLLCQIVRVVKDGEPVRMSKRAGTFITLRDLVDEVGADAVRFTMLTRKSDAQMDFDLDMVVSKTRENPVFYVQYAHARCRSVLRHASELFSESELSPENLAQVDLSVLKEPEEIEVMLQLASFARSLKSAARDRDPHRVTLYCLDLASKFHGLWNKGKENKALRFIDSEDKEGTRAHLALVSAIATGIAAGLDVLGVTPVEEMV